MFFFSSRRRHTRCSRDWSSDVCSSDLQCGFQFIANAGAAESKGGELELRAAATEHLQASLGVGYQDAKITEAGESAQAVGSPGFKVPRGAGNNSLSYTHPGRSGWKPAGGGGQSYG